MNTRPTIQQILAQVPTTCPVCGNPTELSEDYAHLTCSNSECEGKFSRKLEIFAKSLDMDWFGKVNCACLSERISDFSELFEMSVDDIVSTGISRGVAIRMHNEINKTRSFPLDKFIAALSIPRCSLPTAKVLAKQYKTLDNFLNVSELDLVVDVEQFGEGMAEIIYKGIQAAKPTIYKLLKYIRVEEVKEQVSAVDLKGMSICITGSLSQPRALWKEKIEQANGKFSTAVSSRTDVLICNAKNSTSSKFKKAQQLGIPIHNEIWLSEKLGIG
jgi:DNA ligase (NAD+)